MADKHPGTPARINNNNPSVSTPEQGLKQNYSPGAILSPNQQKKPHKDSIDNDDIAVSPSLNPLPITLSPWLAWTSYGLAGRRQSSVATSYSPLRLVKRGELSVTGALAGVKG